ncbi:N-acetylated-alpha-linked acidic dipeptidase 2-like [Daphnia pulicaria]|uniref:N-acetylated-alpha-linked acidic dipeptidase 2-like n=1 Tax=Daphnia pulicaria TaxID=35523 RepID=UPI001EE9FC93|nr:N-acetylated-alpha-linked acidic dipeptidase 2-like [Daphnia pulicaria]
MWSTQDVSDTKNMLDKNKKSGYWIVAVAIILCFATGILIGRYGTTSVADYHNFDVRNLVIDEISAEEIDSNLRYLTSTPHVAGTAQDLLQAEWMRDRFLEAGLDEAKTIPYDVLLSYPRVGVMNKVSLIDEQGRINYTTAGRQPPLGSPEEFSDDILHNFNAFSANGVVEGNVVYVHYGRKKDYEYLLSRGINVSGHIALIRLGAIFRGSKVDLAERYGAIGVILFSDRLEKTSQNRNNTYPDSWWMPGTGAEYGHVGRLRGGDLLTPFYPAIESAFRIKEENHPGLPKIPVQAIGYEEAEVILRNISPENSAPTKWIGKMDAPYSLGPSLRNPGWRVRLDVSTVNERRTTFNTIGILRGSVEDDRYVLLGNHRDAWTFGALDPSSGTASMIEIARVFGKMKRDQNWRPRRTIVFCSWGAHEYGLVGSYEWTQQHATVLGQRAVAYLNVDTAVSGNRTLFGNAFPTLKQLLIDTAKLIPNPSVHEIESGHKTVFDTWLAQSRDRDNVDQPMVGHLGGGSDFEGFSYVIGIPAADFGYMKNGVYPTQYSLYDSYHLASNIVDRGFVHHQAVARMWAVAAVTLSDSVILPLDILAYASYLNHSLSLLHTKYGPILQQNGVSLKHVRVSVDHFMFSVKHFSENELKNVDQSNIFAVRRVNDKLMYLERFFIDSKGLPDHPETNHVIFSTSSSDSHNFNTFAGLVDLIVQVENKTESNDPEIWSKIRHHLSVIAFLIGEAGRSLNGDF